MADKILNSALGIDPRVRLEWAPEGDVGKVARHTVLPVCAFADQRLRIGRERRVAQLSLSAVSTAQPCRKYGMWAAEVDSVYPHSSQGNRTPSLRVIPGKP